MCGGTNGEEAPGGEPVSPPPQSVAVAEHAALEPRGICPEKSRKVKILRIQSFREKIWFEVSDAGKGETPSTKSTVCGNLPSSVPHPPSPPRSSVKKVGGSPQEIPRGAMSSFVVINERKAALE
uniref:Uncharacterized protein n=1 Tax=Steinernema glaseri TaxID=37863 RepID=A0A1I8AWB5_9BILA